jgi:trimeric autotransporter adhesin
VPATKTALNSPIDVAVDGAGNLVIADEGTPQFPGPQRGSRVRVVAASNGTFYGQKMIAGDIYTVAGTIAGKGFSGDGGPAVKAAIGEFLLGVQVDTAGNLVLGTADNQRVRVVAARSGTFYGVPMAKGDIYTVAGNGTPGSTGDGGPATSAELDDPSGVTLDQTGNLLIGDTENDKVRMVAVKTRTFYGVPMTADDIYTVAGSVAADFCCDGGPATAAEMNGPATAITDHAGNVVLADETDNRIRVVAAGTGTFYGQSMTKGDLYTVAGTGVAHFSGDGGPATNAGLFNPSGVAVDGAGNLLIADQQDNRIRVVAVKTGTFYGRRMTAGNIYTVAGNGLSGFTGDGGPALAAEFNQPMAVAVDGTGNLVIADTNFGSAPADMGNNRVRVVAASTGTFYGVPMTKGDIYTVGGNGQPGFAGDGGPATKAELDGPVGVGVTGAGNLLVADVNDGRIREITH